MTDPRNEPRQPHESYTPTPDRFREDGGDEEPWTDPVSGVTYPIDPRDVLSPEEYREYKQQRSQRRRTRRTR